MKQQLSLLIISFSQLAQAETAPPGDSDLFKRSTPRFPVGNGEKCDFETSINGVGLVFAKCDPTIPGLTCVGSNLAQNQPGVCRLLVGVGEKCEGFTRPENRTFCKPGLKCVFPPEVTQIPDLQGVCQAITTSTVTATATPTQTTSTVTPTQTSIAHPKQGELCPDGFCADGLTCHVEKCPRGVTCQRHRLPKRCYLTQTAPQGSRCAGPDAIKCKGNLKCEVPTFKCMAMTDSCIIPFGQCVATPTQPAEFGQACAGIAAIQCKTGLTCVVENPVLPDKAGICRKIAQLGERCEGFSPVRARCAEGLTCVFPPNIAQIPDLPGVCRKLVSRIQTAA